MTKCEHHEDYIRLHDELKENLSRFEGKVENKLDHLDKKIETAFDRIDNIKEIQSSRYNEQKETESYVKQLYKHFDTLTLQMQTVINKLDQYIETMAVVQSDTDKNSEFVNSGKKIVFEIIKWLVLVFLGYLIANN